VSTAFSELQASRQEKKATPPAPPDFRLSLKDDGPVSMEIFEQIRKQREDEAARAELLRTSSNKSSGSGDLKPALSFAEAGSAFAADRRRQQEEAETAFAERERQRLLARAAAAESGGANLPEPPDMRALILGDRAPGLGRTLNNASGGNPTLAQPLEPRQPGDALPQTLVVREPSTMSYQETELNLHIYSGDRDWVTNNRENRYNFSVNFDPSNMPTGLRMNPTSTAKFRNIVRIEFVKAIIPGENLEQLVQKTYQSLQYGYVNPYTLTALEFPYLQVRIPELEVNNYGTNQGLNSAFAVLQYDANWTGPVPAPGALTTLSRGFYAMIPKFMKAQKVYSPTPLSTLQKLSFTIQRPDGSPLTTVPDTIDIADIITSKTEGSTTTSGWPYGFDSTQEPVTGGPPVTAGTSAAHYTIRTSTFFQEFQYVVGDRIVLKNLTFAAAPTAGTAAVNQLTDFLAWLQRDEGHIVVAVGYSSDGTSTQANFNVTSDTSNKVGYSNLLVIRGKFEDPAKGNVMAVKFGNQEDTSTNAGPATAGTLTAYLKSTAIQSGRILNASRQIQIAMRIITREVDATSVLRPDNL
jgi:hypothetical protein